jgi:polysaccharide export outer membrane protein
MYSLYNLNLSMKKLAGLIALVPFVMGIVVLSSCGNTRELQYLQGQFDTVKLSQANYPEPLIQKNDLLSITVYSDDPKASAYFNLPVQTTVANTSGITATGTIDPTPGSYYLVDEAGIIQMPQLGKIVVAGLTKAQLDTLVTTRVRDKLQNPYVIIRMISYKITLIGELTKPGQFTIPNERVSLLEAIALAGDLTPYGRRENVLVIREINGNRTFARLDLRNPEILSSPFFYLQPNDVVYVEMNKTKAAVNDQVVVRNIALATSIISVLAIVISLSRTN